MAEKVRPIIIMSQQVEFSDDEWSMMLAGLKFSEGDRTNILRCVNEYIVGAISHNRAAPRKQVEAALKRIMNTSKKAAEELINLHEDRPLDPDEFKKKKETYFVLYEDRPLDSDELKRNKTYYVLYEDLHLDSDELKKDKTYYLLSEYQPLDPDEFEKNETYCVLHEYRPLDPDEFKKKRAYFVLYEDLPLGPELYEDLPLFPDEFKKIKAYYVLHEDLPIGPDESKKNEKHHVLNEDRPLDPEEFEKNRTYYVTKMLIEDEYEKRFHRAVYFVPLIDSLNDIAAICERWVGNLNVVGLRDMHLDIFLYEISKIFSQMSGKGQNSDECFNFIHVVCTTFVGHLESRRWIKGNAIVFKKLKWLTNVDLVNGKDGKNRIKARITNGKRCSAALGFLP